MPADFEASTLWRVSCFDRLHEQSVMGGLHGGDQQTLLSSTLQDELYALERRHESSDALEVIAACMRLQEPALVNVRCHDFVWPVTVFPAQMLYHAPRALVEASEKGLAGASVISVEPAVLRPPGDPMRDRVAADASYWPRSAARPPTVRCATRAPSTCRCPMLSLRRSTGCGAKRSRSSRSPTGLA